jgi:nucleoside-diphosphate-sugar epimerase
MPGPIAVTGAAGWIGRGVCAWLEGGGIEVRRLTRSGSQPGTFAADLSGDQGDGPWRASLGGCAAVIHCAAHVHRPVEDAQERRQFQAVNVDGTRRLLAACKSAGVGRFVLASTVAVYDWSGGIGARKESDRLAPATAYARSKLEAEQLVQGSGLDWRVARIATVYGEGDTANFSRLAGALRRRRFVVPGDGGARKSVLPVTKAAELLARLACLPDAQGSTVNLAAPAAPSLAEICAAFVAACGFPQPPRAPLAALTAAGFLGDAAEKVGIRLPLTSDILGKLTTATVVDVSRMQSILPDIRWESFEETLRKSSLYYGGIV